MGPNIYLTGFSGSGKTTVGKQVAAMTGWTYRDTDDEIVAATGRAIEDIFRSGRGGRVQEARTGRLGIGLPG